MKQESLTSSPAAVPLIELLRSVPPKARLLIDTPNPLGMDTHSIPVGRLCHEAAEALAAASPPLPAEPAPSEDAITLAFRLYGEDPDTFAPETRAVMDKLRPIVTARLNGAHYSEEPCSVCGGTERGQGGYLSCECPAAPSELPMAEMRKQVLGHYDPNGDRIVTSAQMHSMLNHQGAPGKIAAKEYTVPLFASSEPLVEAPSREKLLDILVEMTHHVGALEEQRPRWEPIVKAELQRRMAGVAPTSGPSEEQKTEMKESGNG